MRTFLSLASLTLAVTAVVPPAQGAERRLASADFSTCALPKWPAQAWHERQHGVVTLAFLVDDDGVVQDSKVATSSGYPLLDEAARQGIRQCRFKPATPRADAKPRWTHMQYVWSLSPDVSPEAVDAAVRVADLSAAEKGDVNAQLRVARRFLTKVEAERDAQQGVNWLKRAAEGGHPEAMERLATLLRNGRDVPHDVPAALAWYRKAAETGRAPAQYWTGMMLLNGETGPRDGAGGEAWLRKAAEQDYAPAQARLALELLRRDAASAEAVALLNDAVAQGNPFAQGALGRVYELGKAVPRDYRKAAALYHESAAAGDPDSQKALARLVQKGLTDSAAPAAGQ
jgi:uncharacterized protein